jgi:hypothetical protein
MDDFQRFTVDDHIGGLVREAERLRNERRANEHTPSDTGPAVAGGRAGVQHSPARVRLGHWLIDLGSAVAGGRPGTSKDPQSGAAGRAA